MKYLLAVPLALLAGCVAIALTGCAYNPPRKIDWRSPFQAPVVIEHPATSVTLSPPEVSDNAH